MAFFTANIFPTNWIFRERHAERTTMAAGSRLAARARAAVVLLAIATSATATAANYSLELVSPRAVGTAPAAGLAVIPDGHRVFRAYPGLPYNIRAVVTGGAYPFTFALTNAPVGMTINSSTGEINWPNPTGTSVTPTITVTDAEGTQRSSPWTIAVTVTGFKFVDALNGTSGGDGSFANPWRTLAQVHASGTNSDIVYFRAGAYTPAGITRTSVGTPWERVEFGPTKPARWLAYPGETPVVNFGYAAGADPSALIRIQSNAATPIYLDGFEGRNFRNIGFQLISGSSDYTILRRLRMHDMVQGVDGENPSAVMWTSSYSDSTKYCAVQDSEFYNLNGGGALKFYSQNRALVEDNLFRDSSYGFDLKAHVPRFDVRRNAFRNIPNYVLFGNMNTSGSGEPASGEIRFNNINTPNAYFSLDINQDGQAADIHIDRNTLVGPVRVRNADSADGPFRFRNNVIVNNNSGTPAGSRVVLEAVSDTSRVVITDSLAGTSGSGIIDSSGALTGDFVRYLGTHGHQLGSPGDRPNPPTDVAAE